MRIFLDTSVLVASGLRGHGNHAPAYTILDRVQRGKDEGFISAHSLAEMYAVLTKLSPPFRHTAEQALFSIEENVLQHFKIKGLTEDDYAVLIREAARAGIQGGTVYDLILLTCAARCKVEKVFTLNPKHFRTIAPKSAGVEILAP